MIALRAAVPAVVLGALVAVVLGDPLPGVAFSGGILAGIVGAMFIVPALKGAPAGVAGAAIDDSAAGWAEFHRELARARRFDGQFAIVRFANVEPLDEATATSLRNGIAASARRIDRVWVDEGHILMLLPETTQAAAATVLDRIRAAVPVALATEPGVAHFPEHGITSGALIAAVYGAGAEEVPTPISAVRPDIRPQPAAGVAIEPDVLPTGTAEDVAGQSG